VRRRRSKVAACPRAGRKGSARRWIPRTARGSSVAASGRLNRASRMSAPSS
jgi:hypothetical protein